MPTGYTATLCKRDVPFNEFVMTCARAMGACVMMRDEPFDAPIPERFEPSDYHVKKLAEAEAMQLAVDAMSADECQAKAVSDYEAESGQYQRYIEERKAVRERIYSMMREVKAWVPPSDDHKGLQEFMLEQLATTLDFDGDPSYYEKHLKELRRQTGVEWKAKQMAKAQKDIDYHHAELLKEVDRTNARNIWLKLLRTSLVTP